MRRSNELNGLCRSLLVTAVWLALAPPSLGAEPARLAAVATPAVAAATRQFIATNCLDCHDAVVKESGLDLAGLSSDLQDPLAMMAWVGVYDRVREGKMPPPEAKQPTAPQREEFLTQLAEHLRGAALAKQAHAGRAVARRLNREEYQNSLRDLLFLSKDYRPQLPQDDRELGFDKVAGALPVSAEHLEAYLAVASAALDEALNTSTAPVVKERLPQRIENLTPLQQKVRYSYTSAPDGALVSFSDQWDNINGFVAREGGLYRFRVRARSFQSARPIKARLRAGLDAEKSRRLITYTEFPAAGGEIEVTTLLEPRETLRICGIGVAPWFERNISRHRVPLSADFPASKYGGPGLALEWVEVEGPLPTARFVDHYLKGVDLAKATRVDAERLLEAFLPRAFRRSVSRDELEKHLAVFDQLGGAENFVASLKAALQTALCSPQFLYLQGPPGPLDDFALASRLAYFLTNTAPDDELRVLAEQGQLHQADVLHEQVDRLLTDSRSDAFIESFAGQWLDLHKIHDTTPDVTLYPEFDELLEWSSVRETHAFIRELIDDDLSLLNFVQSDFAMLNDRLAQHYDIPNIEGIAIRKVGLPANSVRGGLLGQASVLKVTANGTTSSPVIRGAWVMDRILGKTPPPPPAAVDGLEPDIRGATTVREQLAKHRNNQSCAACHAQIDPPGFALENFDVIGGWRDEYRASGRVSKQYRTVTLPLYINYKELKEDPKKSFPRLVSVGMGQPVDGSGEFQGQPFQSVNEFRKLLLADDEQLARAFVTKLIVYSTGAGLDFADRQTVEELVQKLKTKNYGLRTTIHEVVQSPLFLNR